MLTPVAKAVLGSDGNTLTVSGLDGDRDAIYVCLFRGVIASPPGLSSEIEFRANGAATGDAGRLQGGSTAQFADDLSPQAIGEVSGTPTTSCDYWFMIYPGVDLRSAGISVGMKSSGASVTTDIQHIGFGIQDLSNLTSFDLVIASGTFQANTTKCWVWRLEEF